MVDVNYNRYTETQPKGLSPDLTRFRETICAKSYRFQVNKQELESRLGARG